MPVSFEIRRVWGWNETMATRRKLGIPTGQDLIFHWAQKAGVSLVTSAPWHLPKGRQKCPQPPRQPRMSGGKQREEVSFSHKEGL